VYFDENGYLFKKNNDSITYFVVKKKLFIEQKIWVNNNIIFDILIMIIITYPGT